MEKYLEYGNEGIDCKGNKWKRIPLGPFAKDISDQKFNRLTPLFRVEKNKKISPVYWLCKCNCGNLLSTSITSLRAETTKSCGCAHIEQVSQLHNTPEDLTGQIFGFLLAKQLVPKELRPKNKNRYAYWYCDCLNCGTKNKMIASYALTSGNTRSCGCIKSFGEKKVSQLLTTVKVNYITQYHEKQCQFSTGGSAFFDFAIFNNDKTIAYFIEYQGEQHYYEYNYHGYFPKEKVDLIKLRDKEKERYCQENNIPLICISYKDFNKLDISNVYFPELIH